MYIGCGVRVVRGYDTGGGTHSLHGTSVTMQYWCYLRVLAMNEPVISFGRDRLGILYHDMPGLIQISEAVLQEMHSPNTRT